MKSHWLILVFLSVGCMFLCTGCASIICGSEKTINVTSSPVESEFSIINRKGNIIAKGVTPTNVTLKRGDGWFRAGDYTIKLSKAGYKETIVPIKQDLETGWYGLGNLVFGGPIGWIIVDPLTGAMYNIKDVNVSLMQDQEAVVHVKQQQVLASETADRAINTKNCGICGKPLQEKDGLSIVYGKRLCAGCYEKNK